MNAFYGVGADEVEAARAASVHGDAEALARIRDETVDLFMAAGDAEDLRKGLDRWQAAGFGAVSFSGSLGPDTLAALDMIGAEMARRRAARPSPPAAAEPAGGRGGGAPGRTRTPDP